MKNMNAFARSQNHSFHENSFCDNFRSSETISNENYSKNHPFVRFVD